MRRTSQRSCKRACRSLCVTSCDVPLLARRARQCVPLQRAMFRAVRLVRLLSGALHPRVLTLWFPARVVFELLKCNERPAPLHAVRTVSSAQQYDYDSEAFAFFVSGWRPRAARVRLTFLHQSLNTELTQSQGPSNTTAHLSFACRERAASALRQSWPPR